jgi:hypothetical protein
MTLPEGPPPRDPSQASSAHVWGLLQDAKSGLAIDAEVADAIAEEFPGVKLVAQHSRWFMQRAVAYLVREKGVRQVMDIGPGLPADDDHNTHQVAQRHAPDARVVYVDNDPVVLAHARALMTGTPQGRVGIIDADVREVDRVLAQAAETLDLGAPVAVLFLSMLGHIDDPTAAEGQGATAVVQRYMAGLTSGSWLVMCDSIDSRQMLEATETFVAGGGDPYFPRPADKLLDRARGLEVIEPGFLPISRWRPDDPSDQPEIDQWGLVARKP